MYVVFYKIQGENYVKRFDTKAKAVVFQRKYGGFIDLLGDKYE